MGWQRTLGTAALAAAVLAIDARGTQLGDSFAEPIGRGELADVAALKEMELLRKGSRLSVQPVRKKEFNAIIKIADKQES